jgi:hypothetical protein
MIYRAYLPSFSVSVILSHSCYNGQSESNAYLLHANYKWPGENFTELHYNMAEGKVIFQCNLRL